MKKDTILFPFLCPFSTAILAKGPPFYEFSCGFYPKHSIIIVDKKFFLDFEVAA